jgi:hypothetical protein
MQKATMTSGILKSDNDPGARRDFSFPLKISLMPPMLFLTAIRRGAACKRGAKSINVIKRRRTISRLIIQLTGERVS